MWYNNVNFEAVFFAFSVVGCKENSLKINITPYGEDFY